LLHGRRRCAILHGLHIRKGISGCSGLYMVLYELNSGLLGIVLNGSRTTESSL
jgi:hypothetical protein